MSNATATAEDPPARRYLVRFSRIGTSRRVANLTVEVPDGDAALEGLADRIRTYARRFQLPGNVVVLVDPGGTGMLSVGGRDAGDFVWAEQE